MNEIVNKFLLGGDKFMTEMHLKQDLLIVLEDPLQKTKKEFKNLKKQKIKGYPSISWRITKTNC